jgi:hypothetical protein
VARQKPVERSAQLQRCPRSQPLDRRRHEPVVAVLLTSDEQIGRLIDLAGCAQDRKQDGRNARADIHAALPFAMDMLGCIACQSTPSVALQFECGIGARWRGWVTHTHQGLSGDGRRAPASDTIGGQETAVSAGSRRCLARVRLPQGLIREPKHSALSRRERYRSLSRISVVR